MKFNVILALILIFMSLSGMAHTTEEFWVDERVDNSISPFLTLRQIYTTCIRQRQLGQEQINLCRISINKLSEAERAHLERVRTIVEVIQGPAFTNSIVGGPNYHVPNGAFFERIFINREERLFIECLNDRDFFMEGVYQGEQDLPEDDIFMFQERVFANGWKGMRSLIFYSCLEYIEGQLDDGKKLRLSDLGVLGIQSCGNDIDLRYAGQSLADQHRSLVADRGVLAPQCQSAMDSQGTEETIQFAEEQRMNPSERPSHVEL